jgi:hypothetical protein
MESMECSESVTQSFNFTEVTLCVFKTNTWQQISHKKLKSQDDFANMPMELLYTPDGFSSVLSPTFTLLEENDDPFITSPILTELGAFNEPVFCEPPHQNVVVEPVNIPWEFPQQEITVDEYTASYLLTPPTSVSSSTSDDENIIIVCSDNKTKISVAELNKINIEQVN